MIRSRRSGRFIKAPVQLPQITWVILLALILASYAGLNVGWVLGAENETHTPLASDYATPTTTPSPTMPAPTVTVQPVPEFSNGETVTDGSVRNEIVEYIKSKDWPVDTVLRIATCESGLNPQAIGDINLPDGGPVSVGVFQIRAFANRPSIEQLMDYVVNVDWAYGMWKAQGGFQAWTCSK